MLKRLTKPTETLAAETDAKRAEHLQTRVDELERQLANAVADARVAGMIHERMLQAQGQQFEANIKVIIEEGRAEIGKRDARIAELQGGQ